MGTRNISGESRLLLPNISYLLGPSSGKRWHVLRHEGRWASSASASKGLASVTRAGLDSIRPKAIVERSTQLRPTRSTKSLSPQRTLWDSTVSSGKATSKRSCRLGYWLALGSLLDVRWLRVWTRKLAYSIYQSSQAQMTDLFPWRTLVPLENVLDFYAVSVLLG